MIVMFDTVLAKKLGLGEAILLQHFAYQLPYFKTSKVNYYEGKYWIDESIDALVETFSFWSKEQILQILDSLVAKKAIMKGNFGGDPRIIWVTLTDKFEKIFEIGG